MTWISLPNMLLFALFALIASPTRIAAQHTPVHFVEGRLSVGSMSVRDDVLIPYAFTGPAATLGARYQLRKGPHSFDASLLGSLGILFTQERELGVAAIHEGTARYTHDVAANARRTTAVGPSVRYAHELAYLEEWDDAHGYWLASLMAGVSAKHREPLLRRADLELNLDLGLIGVRSRPPARRLNKQDALIHADFYFDRLSAEPAFAWLLNTVVVRAEALMRFRRTNLPEGAGWGVGYETRFSWADEPKPFADWYNGIIVAYAWSFL